MVSLRASSSQASSLRSASEDSLLDNYEIVPPSPAHSDVSNSSSSTSSSQVSLGLKDEENDTVTANRTLAKRKGKRKSQEDLKSLAVSTRITELSYSISDIQTRIFEIQELRHKSQSSSDATDATNDIDRSLMGLEERLAAVSQGVKSVNEALQPLMDQDPANGSEAFSSEEVVILRKHVALMNEWEAAQSESETLKDELKEDKWLIVFRTVTEQAGGLMTSLEKGVNRCQDFINQIYQRQSEEFNPRAPPRSEKSIPTLESYATLQQSYEAKKKHYIPAITKVLSVLDKGAQDRVTKNGECLRRHAESMQRWRNLRDRINRTDDDMERTRRILQGEEFTPSEAGSNASGQTSKSKNGYPGVSPGDLRSKTKAPSTLSRSISPFRKLARKIKGSPKLSTTPVTPTIKHSKSREPVPTLRHRSSLLVLGNQPDPPVTPEWLGHKYSQSLSPESAALTQTRWQQMDLVPDPTVKSRPKWNSSTKVEAEVGSGTLKGKRPNTPSGISPSVSGTISVSANGESPHSRSLSRASMASSRPWSPVTSSANSTTQSSLFNRPPSRMRPASRASQTFRTPSRSQMQTPAPSRISPPRPRPKTPSSIPQPSTQLGAMFDEADSVSSAVRGVSPTFSASVGSAYSASGRETPGYSLVPAPRPPSRSMIPIPSLKFSSASRPSSAMSDYADSPEAMYKRTQTPEAAVRQRVMHLPVYPNARATPRPSFHKVPPSSFRDGLAPKTPVSRPSSRASPRVSGADQNAHVYVPVHSKDPLDVEIAQIVNSIPHGLLIERMDPPLKSLPKEGDELRAQYAISNLLSRKVITCRLTTLTRLGAKGSSPVTMKKVMCRVGGGWQDLQLYILNRQAGL